jgi:hypothetical protein
VSKTLYHKYLDALGVTGIPNQYTRWAFISIVAAAMGRRRWIEFGHDTIYPNLYVIFIDKPGTSKSRAIVGARKYLEAAGYRKFSADKTSRAQFLTDLAKSNQMDDYADDTVDDIMIGGDETPCEVYVCQDELSAFLGQKDYDFLETITAMWDTSKDVFRGSYKTVSSYEIYKPVLNLIGGTTPTKMTDVLGENAIGGGLLSRMIVVNAPLVTTQFNWPQTGGIGLDETIKKELARILMLEGPLRVPDKTKRFIERLWNSTPALADRRFAYYNSRRNIQLLKLCINICAQENYDELSIDVVRQANAVLYAAEIRMPSGIGEFGRSRNSDLHQLIMEEISNSREPVDPRVLYKRLATELDGGFPELVNQLHVLADASKIQAISVGKRTLYLPLIDAASRWHPDLLDFTYLTEEESPDVIRDAA